MLGYTTATLVVSAPIPSHPFSHATQQTRHLLFFRCSRTPCSCNPSQIETPPAVSECPSQCSYNKQTHKQTNKRKPKTMGGRAYAYRTLPLRNNGGGGTG